MSSMRRAEMGPPVADLDARLAVLVKTDLERVERLADVAVGVILHELPHVARQLVLERLGEGRLGDRLAGILIDRGLGVEALQVAGAADHEQPDDVLGSGSEVRLPVGWLPACRAEIARPSNSVTMKHRAQDEAREAHPDVREERPSRYHQRVPIRVVRNHLRLPMAHGYRIVMKSLWLNSTCTRFSRARSKGSWAAGTAAAGPAANGVRRDRSANRRD